MSSACSCPIRNMDIELVKARSKYLKSLLQYDTSGLPATTKVLSSYPVVLAPSFDPTPHFEPGVYYASIHWLGENGCYCRYIKYPWRQIVNVAHFLGSDYLAKFVLEQITFENSLEMLACFANQLNPESRVWKSIQNRIQRYLRYLTRTQIPAYFKEFRARFGMTFTANIEVVNRSMLYRLQMQFHQENQYGSSRHFVGHMLTYFSINDPFIEYMGKCILYYYTFPTDRVFPSVQNDVNCLQTYRAGTELAIEKLASTVNVTQTECCVCHQVYVPRRPAPATVRPIPTPKATVFMPCCFRFAHQSCFQTLVTNGDPCPVRLCHVPLSLFQMSTDPGSTLQIYLSSIRNRLIASFTESMPMFDT